MLRTTYICIGMLYFSKGIYIIRKMMIPDETRSILGNNYDKFIFQYFYFILFILINYLIIVI